MSTPNEKRQQIVIEKENKQETSLFSPTNETLTSFQFTADLTKMESLMKISSRRQQYQS